MTELKRKASAEWQGDLPTGKGRMSTSSGAVNDVAYSFTTRFENTPGTNPEELIAAAHAGCVSMAFANTLAKKGYNPESIQTQATCIMTDFKIRKMVLDIKGRVPGIDSTTFKQIAEEAEKGCPVSTLLRPGLEIELNADLM